MDKSHQLTVYNKDGHVSLSSLWAGGSVKEDQGCSNPFPLLPCEL